ncbi:hypothetical protein IAE30_28760 [Pantoea sp. S61]|nr:hypothetical protein [Pantoea sp. S61]
MNNQDEHERNFAFTLNKNEECPVSPAYDLTFQSHTHKKLNILLA